jgi:hypothetical protein
MLRDEDLSRYVDTGQFPPAPLSPGASMRTSRVTQGSGDDSSLPPPQKRKYTETHVSEEEIVTVEPQNGGAVAQRDSTVAIPSNFGSPNQGQDPDGDKFELQSVDCCEKDDGLRNESRKAIGFSTNVASDTNNTAARRKQLLSSAAKKKFEQKNKVQEPSTVTFSPCPIHDESKSLSSKKTNQNAKVNYPYESEVKGDSPPLSSQITVTHTIGDNKKYFRAHRDAACDSSSAASYEHNDTQPGVESIDGWLMYPSESIQPAMEPSVSTVVDHEIHAAPRAKLVDDADLEAEYH